MGFNTRYPSIPLPGPGFSWQLQDGAEIVGFPMQTLSVKKAGNITASATAENMGIISVPGRINFVVVTAESLGLDAAEDLYISIDIKKNGTSIMNNLLVLGSHGTDGTTQGSATSVDVDPGEYNVVPGDIITADIVLERTASPGPGVEMADVSVAVNVVL